ncbi:hypothetical protein ACMU_03905 [Actibacterium mucosum KCTC 23349]|uniref:Uncharacterized protein n=1 Tax=Actibacterium mucosum KCTC 23349 TaxID=1454373 RepID=A0A037ZD22_9RHOB|nr:hypothetical protein [Actibacterium mucosum]KAJ54047.1 hypothetical protein ACMU_03905 [Actibacterium mucosum KCTC 23349]
MTEMMGRIKIHKVNVVAFIGALILAPVLVGVIGAPYLLIPTGALVFGMKPYLIFGTPFLLIAVALGLNREWGFACVGFVANLVFLACFDMVVPEGIHPLYAIFSCLFAAFWSAIFFELYCRFSGQPAEAQKQFEAGKE